MKLLAFSMTLLLLTGCKKDSVLTPDTGTVTVVPPPNRFSLYAGDDVSIFRQSSVTLTATVINDSFKVRLRWSFISGPQTAQFSAPDSVSTVVSNLRKEGLYKVQLKATDERNVVLTDTVSILAVEGAEAAFFYSLPDRVTTDKLPISVILRPSVLQLNLKLSDLGIRQVSGPTMLAGLPGVNFTQLYSGSELQSDPISFPVKGTYAVAVFSKIDPVVADTFIVSVSEAEAYKELQYPNLYFSEYWFEHVIEVKDVYPFRAHFKEVFIMKAGDTTRIKVPKSPAHNNGLSYRMEFYDDTFNSGSLMLYSDNFYPLINELVTVILKY